LARGEVFLLSKSSLLAKVRNLQFTVQRQPERAECLAAALERALVLQQHNVHVVVHALQQQLAVVRDDLVNRTTVWSTQCSPRLATCRRRKRRKQPASVRAHLALLGRLERADERLKNVGATVVLDDHAKLDGNAAVGVRGAEAADLGLEQLDLVVDVHSRGLPCARIEQGWRGVISCWGHFPIACCVPYAPSSSARAEPRSVQLV